MTLRSTILRSYLVATGRNMLNGETRDWRMYMTRYGEQFVVKTIMEMEFTDRRKVKGLNWTFRKEPPKAGLIWYRRDDKS
jgi:hypothetical protein